MYKIEIWRFHVIHETYTSNNIKDILKWYRNNWQIAYENGNCSFEVYKNGKELSFDELNEKGFFVSFEKLDEEEE
nr:MAG TPA: hypothetical protein [Caudoviricetes sp.]